MSEDSEDEDSVGEPARLHTRSITARAAINRIRGMPQQPGVVATWGDNGIVTVLDAKSLLAELVEETQPQAKSKAVQVLPRVESLIK